MRHQAGGRGSPGGPGGDGCAGGGGQAGVYPGAQVQRAGHLLQQRDHGVLFAAGQATHADLATALLDSLTRPDLYRRTAYVAN
jgi:hypothetical protein